MSAPSSLLEEVLPEFDVRSRHVREVDAPARAVAEAAETYRMDRDASLPTTLLIRLRGLALPNGTFREAMAGSGFTLLAERPGEELVLGTVGRFWALREAAHIAPPSDLDAFRAFDEPASAAAAVSLRIEPLAENRTLLSTETRVRCTDDAGRRRFRVYWFFIKRFSGLIRLDLLKKIADRAEQ